MKWRRYPEDVLPLWVAEDGCADAGACCRGACRGCAAGDTGYPLGDSYAEALGGFAVRRWGWDGVVAGRAAIVPDVMLGVVEMLKLVTGTGGGDPVVVNSPVYPPFFDFVAHMDHEVVEAPLGGEAGSTSG